MHPRLSTAMLGFILTAAAVLAYAAMVLYGASIDGRRQKIREQKDESDRLPVE